MGQFVPAPLGRVACRPGFTLIELLIVITIILIVSAVALPTVLPALQHRQVSETARLVQGALAGARDKAIRTNLPSGIRLLPDPALSGVGGPLLPNGQPNPYAGIMDPTQILACNRIIPLDQAPEYSEGFLDVFPSSSPPAAGSWTFQAQAAWANPLSYWGGGGGPTVLYPLGSVLMVVETTFAPGTCPAQPNPPTNWFWNIRVGDKIQINNAGPWYTVVGPMAIPPTGLTVNNVTYSNPEMFVNVGPPGVASPLVATYPGVNGNCVTTYQPDFLFLVNGQDDDGNGWIDEGWDGVDNDGNGYTDDVIPHGASSWPGEWEAERWQGTLLEQAISASPPRNQAYAIKRRPAPSPAARELALPSGVVIDLTGWGAYVNQNNVSVPAPQERSRVPSSIFNPFTGYVDIVLNPDGTLLPTTLYSSPSSFNMGSSFVHLWLAERGDLAAPSPIQPASPVLPLPQGLAPALFSGQELKGEYALVTFFTRTGQVLSSRTMPFLYNASEGGFTNNPGTTTNPLQFYNSNYPFIQAQQGVASAAQ